MLAGELRDVRERRRVLLTPAADGGGLAALLRAVAADTGLRCWLLTGTGRVIAGAGELTRAAALRLAVRYHHGDTVASDPDSGTGSGSGAGGGGSFTLVPVGGDRRSVTDWFVACAGRERDWGASASEALADLESDAAMERARMAARRSGERGLAEAVIGRLAAGAGDAAHTEALLRAAGLHPGYLAVSFATGRGPTGGVAGTGGVVPGVGGGELDRELAEELLGHYAGRAAVAVAGDEILAVLSAGTWAGTDGTGLAGTGAAGTAGTGLGAWLRETSPVLRAAGIRLTVGLSAPVAGTAGLTGALREASAARRAASARTASARPASARPGSADPVVIAASAEVDSHELLLASVPAPVLGAFRDRLLGPLRDYDTQHNAELMPTLRSFLDCDGSWSACAARMYVHVNTVRYRIGRIEALTGRDLSSLPDRVDFFLALRGS